MDSFTEEMEKLRRLVSGREPAGLPKYIATAQLNKPYATGTLAPLLGVIQGTRTTTAGVVVPKFDPVNQPLDYFSGFLGLDEYVGKVAMEDSGVYDNDKWIDLLVRQHPRESLIVELAWLNSIIRVPKQEAEIRNQFRATLLGSLGSYFDQAMGQQDLNRVFLARQPILRAIRRVLMHTGEIREK